MRRIGLLAALIGFLVGLSPLLSADSGQKVEMLFFYEEGCPHCGRIERFLQDRIEPNYPVEIHRYEIHDPENAQLFQRVAEAYDVSAETPAVFVGDSVFQKDTRSRLFVLERRVRELSRKGAPSPLKRLEEQKPEPKKTGQDSESMRGITLGAVIWAAAVDAINPCAFGVLTLLLGTILLGSNNRRRVIGAGLAFTASTYISYLLMGFGLLSAIHIAGVQHYIYVGVAILAILIGLWNMKDYFWYGRWFSIEVPQKWRPALKKITRGVTSVPGAFGIGFVTSLLLLPCTSGPYVVIIGMLGNTATRPEAVGLLILYNLIFVIPFVVITVAVGFGLTTPQKVEEWRKHSLEKLHLATGLVMVALGIVMIVLVSTGVL